MATATAPDSDQRHGFMVVTQVVPSSAAGQNGAGANIGVPNYGVPIVTSVSNIQHVAQGQLQKFLRVQPKALGTIQIMIGVLNLLFGIMMAATMLSFSVYSGVSFWGGIIFIVTGSLSVAAENHINSCLVKGSLGMNVLSTISAGIGIIFFILDFVVDVSYYNYYFCYNGSYEACQVYHLFQSRSYGTSGILLVFCILQFIISIILSSFGCKATCSTEPMVSVVAVPSNQPGCCSVINPFYPQSGQRDAFYITNPAVNVSPSPANPPAYSPNSEKTEQ
ncbi:membrane-spanning 4-domains subfamily A member 4A-like [Hoplias malabaricus]|uniref:membrane-spanning 4-domains subfamily A member 4A-like n=1 Tax=Hoplias malabaricus TaxID=27720 RepID=UPI003461EEAF